MTPRNTYALPETLLDASDINTSISKEHAVGCTSIAEQQPEAGTNGKLSTNNFSLRLFLVNFHLEFCSR